MKTITEVLAYLDGKIAGREHDAKIVREAALAEGPDSRHWSDWNYIISQLVIYRALKRDIEGT